MNKRGQAETIIFIVVVLGIFTAGAYGTVQILSENRYVGDSSTNTVYDLKYCDTAHILKENIITFSTKKEAYDKGFKDATCN